MHDFPPSKRKGVGKKNPQVPSRPFHIATKSILVTKAKIIVTWVKSKFHYTSGNISENGTWKIHVKEHPDSQTPIPEISGKIIVV